jgi:hypothetical protein
MALVLIGGISTKARRWLNNDEAVQVNLRGPHENDAKPVLVPTDRH